MAAKYWFAADYNTPIPQMAESNVPVIREFTAIVNSGGGAVNGQNKITSLATTGPDIIALATLPGQGVGIVIDNYYFDFGILDTGGASAALVLELGLLLTSTVNGSATSSLDTGSTSMANAGYFATLITLSGNNQQYRLNPVVMATKAATPVLAAVTYAAGALPLMITNQPGGNTGGNVGTQPNSGLYDLVLQVTTSANTVSAVDAYIHGWIEYHTCGFVIQS